jgi:hypothetical protein
VLAQQVEEGRAVELGPALRLPGQGRWRAARPERLHQLRERPRASDDVDALVGVVVEVVRVGQDGDVLGRKSVPAVERFGPRLVDLQEPAGGMVLEPFPHVSLGRPRALRQLRGGGRAIVGQGSIEAETLPQIDRVQLEGAQGILEQPFDQGRGPVLPVGRVGPNVV